MINYNFPIKKNIKILSLGAESVGRFSFYNNGQIFISADFGDILNEKKLKIFKKNVLSHIKNNWPDIIITDLHPLYNSTIFGDKLAKKLKIPHIKVQHHIAHIFSAIGDCIMESKVKSQKSKVVSKKNIMPNTFYGIASDGTGYGLDKNIWGGEVFQVKKSKNETLRQAQSDKVERIGSLEEQIMIGGDLAVQEPARMLISILSKFLSKEEIYLFVKKYYNKNEFELLYNQLRQNFNCQKTTSTGRILDAVAVLLGFAENKRDYKHEATKLLEENSTLPYDDIESRITNYESRKIIDTTYLFEYLINNINKDKQRLAATAQEYIAKGFYEVIRKKHNSKFQIPNSFFAGGMANNKIISSYLENKGVYTSKKIPRGDEGIAFGQIIYYLYN